MTVAAANNTLPARDARANEEGHAALLAAIRAGRVGRVETRPLGTSSDR